VLSLVKSLIAHLQGESLEIQGLLALELAVNSGRKQSVRLDKCLNNFTTIKLISIY